MPSSVNRSDFPPGEDLKAIYTGTQCKIYSFMSLNCSDHKILDNSLLNSKCIYRQILITIHAECKMQNNRIIGLELSHNFARSETLFLKKIRATVCQYKDEIFISSLSFEAGAGNSRATNVRIYTRMHAGAGNSRATYVRIYTRMHG